MDSPATLAPGPTKALPRLPFERVQPAEIEQHWAAIEPGLIHIRALAEVPWKPADIKSAVADGAAALYVNPKGFLVLEQRDEPFSRRKYLLVWVMWMCPGAGKAIRQEALLFLDAVKAAHDCEFIEFISPREGFAALQPDFMPYMTIWRRP